MKKILSIAVLGLGLWGLSAVSANASVTVSPMQTERSSFETFTVAVVSEKEAVTTAVRVYLSPGFSHVTPNVKFGWNIFVAKEVGTEMVTYIEWKGGRIPPSQREEFAFTAQVPERGDVLVWETRQEYADGTFEVIEEDHDAVSKTQLVETVVDDDQTKRNIPIVSIVSLVALGLSLITLYMVQKGRQA